MRTRSGKKLHDQVEVLKRKRNSVVEPERLPTDEPSYAQQPLYKRQKKSRTNLPSTKPLSVQPTLQYDDAISIVDKSSFASNKKLPVQSASRLHPSIVTNDNTATTTPRQTPGPSVEELLDLVRDVSLSSYTCFSVRTYLESRSRAFRTLCQKDAEHKARLVIQELKKLGVASNFHTTARDGSDDESGGSVCEIQQNLNIGGDDGDDDDDSRYTIGRRRVGEGNRARPAAPKLSAELILQEREEQEDNSDVAVTPIDSRPTFVRPKQVGLPSTPPAPLENHGFTGGAKMGPNEITTASHNEATKGKPSKGKKLLNNQDLRKEQEERALAMREKAKEISRTARGAIMFTVTEAIQFLADLDEKTASTSVMTDEIEVGEFLPYPVQKPYHLGAMGRYRRETSVSDVKCTIAPSDASSAMSVSHYGFNGSADAPTLNAASQPVPLFQASRHNKYRMPAGPYAGYTFKSVPHSYLRFLQANPIEFEQYEGLREVFDSCWPTGMPDPNPATYRFSFGPYLGKRLDDVPEEYLNELEASKEVKHSRSRQFRSLAAAFKLRKAKENSTSDVVASSIPSDMATHATNTAVTCTAKSRAAPNLKTRRGHEPFVFQHGRWAGVNIDTVPKRYLLQMQEHPDELGKHEGLGEILQFRFPNGLRRQAEYKLKSGPHAGKTLDEVPDDYVAELDKTAKDKALRRALKYHLKEKEKKGRCEALGHLEQYT